MNNGSSNSTYTKEPTKLSRGAIAGIVVGVVFTVSVSGLVFWKIRGRTATTRANHDNGSASDLQMNNMPESHSLESIPSDHPSSPNNNMGVSAREPDQGQRYVFPVTGANAASPVRTSGETYSEVPNLGVSEGTWIEYISRPLSGDYRAATGRM